MLNNMCCIKVFLVLIFNVHVGASGPVKLAKKEAAPKKASPPKEASATKVGDSDKFTKWMSRSLLTHS